MSFLARKCVFYRPEHNTKVPHGTEFWSSWDETYQRIESKNRWEKWVHLSIYHVYSQGYGYKNVKNGSFFVFSADNKKKSVTVWSNC